MRKKYEDEWPLFEKFLGYLRYLKIAKYIWVGDRKPVWVDIGCGYDGRFLRSISKRIHKGYGFDIRANEKDYGNVRIVNNRRFNGDLPLKSAVVDRVSLLAVLEHLPFDTMLVTEAARVLKPGGLLIMTTPTPLSKPLLEFLSYKMHLISEGSIREHKHYYNEKELRDILERENLEFVSYKKFQFGMNEIIVGRKK